MLRLLQRVVCLRLQGSLNYGLYLNADAYGNTRDITARSVEASRFDLFLAGDAGLNWGLRLGYESNMSTDDNESSGMDLGVSANVAGANLWLNYVMPVTSKIGGNDQTEQNADMRLGLTYGMGDHTLFAEYDSEGQAEGTDAASRINVGLAKVWETSNGATLFYDVSLRTTSGYGTDHATPQDGSSSMRIPVTFGAEIKASSWLTWRASIHQSVYGSHETESGDVTSGRTTILGAGASLTWGDLQIDGTMSGQGGYTAWNRCSIHD